MLPNEYPARFILSGVLLNVFKAPEGKSKEGVSYGGDYRLQLMSADHLRNGETKLTPSEVSVGDDGKTAESYRGQLGQIVQLPVSVFVSTNQLRVVLASERGAVKS